MRRITQNKIAQFLLLFFLLIEGNSFIFAQKNLANVQHFSIEDGLSHRNVYCTYRDSQGFMWIGTQYGLNRFDGYEFKFFTKEHNDLASNEIHQIFQDGEGWLWLLSYNNSNRLSEIKTLSLLNPKTGEVRTLASHFGKDLTFNAQDLYHVIINEDNKTVFLGTNDGRLFIYQKGKKFKSFVKEGWQDIYPSLQINPNTILVESLVPGVTSTMFEVTFEGTVLNAMNSQHFFTLGMDTLNNILGYFTTEHNATNFQLNFASFKPGKKPEPFKLNNKLESLKCDDWSCQIYFRKNDHSFWYKSENRFFVFHPQKEILFDFNIEYPDISKNVIQDIYFDKTDNVWVSTSHGFYNIQLIPNPFQRFLYNPSSTYDANDFISCRGIVRAGNTLWMGTELQRNHKIDLKTSKTKTLPYFEVKELNGLIQTSEGRVVIQGKDDHLLFGQTSLLDYQISDSTNQTIFWADTAYYSIWSMYKDQHEMIWIGTYDGPLGYWKEGMDRIQIYEGLKDFGLHKGQYIYTFLELDKDNMLIGTSDGVYLLNHQKGILKRYWSGGTTDAYFPNDLIFHLIKDKKEEGVIWAATGGGGLIRWEYPGRVQQFTIADGLSNNTIYAVYEDKNGNLWLPSDYGIIQFDKTTHFTKAFLKKDGITDNEFNRTSHYQDEEGNLYFGGLNGITAFNPGDFTNRSDTLDVPLRITAFQQYDAESDTLLDRTSGLLTNPQIVLKPGDNFFNLQFALLEYQHSERIRYAYKIDGQGKDWNIIKGNSLRISGLNYGNTVLQIRGQSANGQFSKQELSIPIQVLKPFYLQSWFLISGILSFLALVFSFYKYRTSQLKSQQKLLEKKVLERTEIIEKQKEELQNLDEVKSRFFANVTHELKTPLTLILGPIQSLIKGDRLNKKDHTFAKFVGKNATNLLNLVNEILDLTKMESGKIELQNQSVAIIPFLHRLTDVFDGIANRKGIQYQFLYDVDQNLHLDLDANKIEKVINNLLSNAFKFTPENGKITVRAVENDSQFHISVKDNGRGIHPEDLHFVFDRYYQTSQVDVAKEGGTGLGLALSREFAKLMKGKLWVESILGEGSTFYFEFPKVKAITLIADGKDFSTEVFLPIDSEINQAEEVGELLNSKTIISTLQIAFPEKATILLVEDTDNLREYIQLLLSERFIVLPVENGKEAWNILRQSNQEKLPDLIISDIMMPEMDGYQLLEKLKTEDHFRDIPVIMLTALSELKDKLRALRIGVDDYITKPFDEEQLIARVENLLINCYHRRQYQKELLETEEEESGVSDNTDEMESATNLSAAHINWLEALESVVQKELTNFHFNVDLLSGKMAMSKRQLERKTKQLTGMTPSKYIQEVRFHQARQMLENKSESSVKAVAYSIGVKDPIHFSRQFKARFGKLPSDYLNMS